MSMTVTATVSGLLEAVAASGIRLTLTDDQQWLEFDAPDGAMTPELRAAIAVHKAKIITILATRSRPAPLAAESAMLPPEPLPTAQPQPVHHAFRRPSATAATVGWPAELAAWLLALTVDDLPPAPFHFGGPWCKIVDPEKFIRTLKCDVRRGPTGPRAATGAIQADLRTLRELLVGRDGAGAGSANMSQTAAA